MSTTAAAAKSTEAQGARARRIPVAAVAVPHRTAPQDLLQRKEGACACGGTCPRCQEKVKLQTKLALGRADDALEREADRVATAVLDGAPRGASGEPASERAAGPSATGPAAPLIQRSATAAPAAQSVPESVHRALEGSGQPLSDGVRREMEARFGVPFGHVRVHTDTFAAESARDVNALAYTVGNHVVFGEGQYQPSTHAGRFLLAHELAHTVQQGSGGNGVVQRFIACGTADQCPPRERGEVSRAASGPMLVGTVSNGISGYIVANFAIGSSALKSGLSSDPTWMAIVNTLSTSTDKRWEVLGLSDCQGSEALNETLRARRASALYAALPAAAQAQVNIVTGAPISDCIADNADEQGRAYNRSAVIRLASTSVSFPEEHVTAPPPPQFVCGPDVTAELQSAVAALKSDFRALTPTQKDEVCDTLDSPSAGLYTWDIVELHNNAWIHQNYRPTCATAGANPPCGSTVQVGSECYYAGSANYVIFGTMCRECFNYYASIPDLSGTYRFRERAMLHLIDLYKGSGLFGLGTPSANYLPSRDWAIAGYRGWPAGGTPPPGDRSNCAPVCPTPFSGPRFRTRWCPHIDPYGACPSGR